MLALQPAYYALVIGMVLNFISLLLNTLLQALILTFEQEYLSFEFMYMSKFCGQMLRAHLRHTLHVCLHRDKPLVVFVEDRHCILQVL